METLRQKLQAAKLEKYEREQSIQENLAMQGMQMRNALMAIGVAALTAGCVTGIIKYDQVRTAEFEKEMNSSYQTNLVNRISTNYTQAPMYPPQKLTTSRKVSDKNAYERSLDSLLEIKDDMSAEDIKRIIEIEKLRLSTYDLTLRELQIDAKNEISTNKVDYLKGRFAKLKQYAPLVESEVAKYNAKFHFQNPLTANHIYAMIEAETGNHPEAFKKDPMQVANQGDHALAALKEGKEYTWQIGDFSFLKGKKHTKIVHWKKQYDKSNMDADSSIKAGIPWLINKAAIRNANGEITGWRSWEEAAKRYNGGGDEQYKSKVQRNVYHLNALTKL